MGKESLTLIKENSLNLMSCYLLFVLLQFIRDR